MLPSFRRGMHFIAEFTCLRQPLVLQQAYSNTGCTVSLSCASEPSEGNRARGHPVARQAPHGCCSAVRNAPGMGTWQLTVSHNDSQARFWPQTRPNREVDAATLAAATLSCNHHISGPQALCVLNHMLLAPCPRCVTRGDMQPTFASRHAENHIAPQHKHPLATGWYLAGCFQHSCETPL